MKTHDVRQARATAAPGGAASQAGSTAQRRVAEGPRQAGEAARIAQLKGDGKGKGKGKAVPKKGKGG